ncbi:MAG: 50S ribosomal protein L11 methyltransferase [Tissierellia bacterium]|nr:50S ribosomal protein L11 methyltransferase [Tissierellia bacterium]
MKWIQMSLHVSKQDEETVLAILNDEFSIEMLEVVDRTLVDELQEHQLLWNYVDDELVEKWPDHVVIKIYIREGESGEAEYLAIEKRLNPYFVVPCDRKMVDEKDWENEWKQYYKPTKIGDKVVIVPTWEDYEPTDGEHVIKMDPGMAFGTGTHETTAMCGALLEKYVKTGDRVFDIGTGSGILSFISLIMGAKEAVGVDIDPLSIKVANENAQINHMDDRVKFVEGDLFHCLEGKAEIIVSNIVAEVIASMVDDLKRFLSGEGLLILSGIIHDRVEMLENALAKAGFRLIEKTVDGEWVAMVAEVVK